MPEAIGPEAHWDAALAEGRFLLQRGRASGRAWFPPRIAEPGTGDSDFDWIEASGRGTIYSLTIVSQRPPAEPYAVVLVELAEGPRLMSRIEGVDPVTLSIGMPVFARILCENGAPLLVFEPARG